MPRKRVPAAQEETGPAFKFKPILGIQPRNYIAAGFSAVLAALLFFLLIFPGLSNPGAMVSFDSLPRGAAVYVDGAWLGATPLQAYVKAGKRQLLLSKAGYAELTSTEDVPGRLFGSLIFPAGFNFTKSFAKPDLTTVLAAAHQEYSRWALGPQSTVLYQHPQILSETTHDLVNLQAAAGSVDSESLHVMEKFLERSLSSADSPVLVGDVLKSAAYVASGPVLSAQGMVKIVTLFIQAQKKYPLLAAWLSSVVPEKLANTIMESSWYKSRTTRAKELLAKIPTLPAPTTAGRTLNVRGNEFIEVPGGAFRMGEAEINSDPEHPLTGIVRPAGITPFFLKKTEVSVAEYAAFLEENPTWKKENSPALIKQNLVDAHYLEEFQPAAAEKQTEPVRFVSFAAAAAYCDWLGRLNGEFRFFLPDESQWEWAARLDAPAWSTSRAPGLTPPAVNAQVPGRLGLRGILGGVWEWTASWYGPASTVFSEPELEKLFPGAERVVRGGSWINQDAGRTEGLRGSQPPAWCTPYLGFRPAAARK